MPNRNRAIVCEGALALMTFTLMLGVAARALQSRPDSLPGDRAAALILQEPQNKPSPDPQQPDAPRPGPEADKHAIFTGTIIKNGEDFVLRDQSGTLYRLDAPSKAAPFEGKSVKVTGKLEETAKLIHVENIEEITT